MQILDNIIILIFPVIAFYAGKKMSDSYNEKRIMELEFQLRLSAAEKGVGYVAPPAKRRAPIGQTFMDKLKENGHAIQQFSSPNTEEK